MSDLISRDDFINSIVCSVSSPCETKQEQRDAQFKQKYTVDAFIKELKRAPAVDAVEVVRCKDCAKRHTPDCLMWYQCSVCGGQWSWETDNDFCSSGKRKESEVSE